MLNKKAVPSRCSFFVYILLNYHLSYYECYLVYQSRRDAQWASKVTRIVTEGRRPMGVPTGFDRQGKILNKIDLLA